MSGKDADACAMVAALALFALLLVGHALADTVLQPPWLAVRKYDPDPNVAAPAMLIHGAVHALPVALVTGVWELALCEMFVHPLIDRGKGAGFYGMKTDQALHTACKLAWLTLALCIKRGG